MLIPIRFFDETDEAVFEGTAELDSETGDVCAVEHDEETSDSPPFLPEGFELRVGILDMGGKELEFTIDVDKKTGRSRVDAEQLAEILAKARAWVSSRASSEKKRR